MKKIAIVFMLLALMLVAAFLCSCKGVRSDAVLDGADILSASDEEKIREGAAKVSGAEFFFVTYDSTRDGFFDGRSFLAQRGLNVDSDAVIIVVDAAGMRLEWSACLYGRTAERMTNGELDRILASARSSTNVPDGALNLMSRISEASAFPWLDLILISVIAGIVVGGIVCGIAAARYKMKIRPTNYPLEHYTSSELTDRQDIFINSRVSVVRVSNDDNKR